MDDLISGVIWQAAAEQAGLPVHGTNWSMDSYDRACANYDRIAQSSWDRVAAAVAQAVSTAGSA